MYCSKCGQEISREVKFCPRCGQKVMAPAEQAGQGPTLQGPAQSGRVNAAMGDTRAGAPEMDAGWTAAEPAWQEVPPAPRPVKKRSRKPVILTVALVLLVAAVGGVFVVKRRSKGDDSDSQRNIAISGFCSDDNRTAYIPLEDGNVVTVQGEDITDACITPDREHIVVIDDGTLYVTDQRQANKQVIADNAQLLNGQILDNAFVWSDQENQYYRTSLKDYTSVQISSDFSWANDLSILYADVDDRGIYEMYLLGSEDAEAQKLLTEASNPDAAYCLAVTDHADMAVWTMHDDTGGHLYAYHEGITTELGDGISDEFDGYANVTRDGKACVVTVDNHLWVIRLGEKEIIHNQVGNGSVIQVRAGKGRVPYTDSADLWPIYVLETSTSYETGEEHTSVARVNENGTADFLLDELGDVLDYEIASGRIVYRNTEGLWTALLDGDAVNNKSRIAASVDVKYGLTGNGAYVYYSEPQDGDHYVLHGYNTATGEDATLTNYIPWGITVYA